MANIAAEVDTAKEKPISLILDEIRIALDAYERLVEEGRRSAKDCLPPPRSLGGAGGYVHPKRMS